MGDGPGREMRSGVEQILHQTEILLFALHARAKFSGALLFELHPKIVTTLQPLFAPGKRSALACLRLDRGRQSQEQQISVPALSDEIAHVLVSNFAAISI